MYDVDIEKLQSDTDIASNKYFSSNSFTKAIDDI
jgi:hypothetical protein